MNHIKIEQNRLMIDRHNKLIAILTILCYFLTIYNLQNLVYFQANSN